MKKYSVIFALLLIAGGCAHQGGMSGTENGSSSKSTYGSSGNIGAASQSNEAQPQLSNSDNSAGPTAAETTKASPVVTGQYSENQSINPTAAGQYPSSSTATQDSSATTSQSLNGSTHSTSSSDLSGTGSGSAASTQLGTSSSDPYKSSTSSPGTGQSSTLGASTSEVGSASTAANPDSSVAPSTSIPAEGGLGTSQIDSATSSDLSVTQPDASKPNPQQTPDKATSTYQNSTDNTPSGQNNISEGSPATTQSGAGSSGAYPATETATVSQSDDTSSAGQSSSDRALAAQIKSKLTKETAGVNGPTQSEISRNIKITAHDGRVTLRGTVTGERDKKIIETRIKEMDGVQSVENKLTVSPLASPAERDSATGVPVPGSTSESGSQDIAKDQEKSNNSSSSSDNQPK